MALRIGQSGGDRTAELALRAFFGLDRPLYAQFGQWVGVDLTDDGYMPVTSANGVLSLPDGTILSGGRKVTFDRSLGELDAAWFLPARAMTLAMPWRRSPQ